MLNRKKVLITNDDGIKSEGILVLARAIASVADVIVAAPDRERSASSHSLSIHNPLKYEKMQAEQGITAYMINGTPADCVKFALFHLVEDVDLVISGINRGPNLGTDIMYSGTVSAALEAAYLGHRAAAISLMSYQSGSDNYDGAARFVADNLDTIYSLALPFSTILNINYPWAGSRPAAGVALAHMGFQEYNDVYRADEFDNAAYWLTGQPINHSRNKPGSDIELIKQGYITITPIAIDMTDYEELEDLEKRNIQWKHDKA